MYRIREALLVISLISMIFFSLVGCTIDDSSNANQLYYSPNLTTADVEVYQRLETELENLRQKSMIPGFSAAVIKNQQISWAAGFGYTNLEKGIEATPSSPYPLASLTKPFAAAIIMQLVEEGSLSLNDPITDYGVNFSSEGVIELRHVLSHTSNGIPGEEYRYNGDRFADLGYLIKSASGRSFRDLLVDRILVPLEMSGTAPRPISMGDDLKDVFRTWLDADYSRVYRKTAKPYRLDQDFKLNEGGCPEFFTPAAGLVSTVLDVAKFDIAMDQNVLLDPETKEKMFTPATSNRGRKLPYGIGWFTQEYKSKPLIWHYGWQPSCGSSLILKMPDENITFILLANTDNLSRPYRLGSGEVFPIDSPLALTFYKLFIFEPQHGLVVPQIDWELREADIIVQLKAIEDERLHEILHRELLAYRKLFSSVGRFDQADKLLNVYNHVYAAPESRLENTNSLLELGARPWIFLPMPGMTHISIILIFVLAVISMLILWPIDFVVARLRYRNADAEVDILETSKAARAARLMAFLTLLSFFLVIILYVIYMSNHPNSGELSWPGGSVLVKILIVIANISVFLAILLIGIAILAWKNKYWNIAWQIHYTLVAIAILSTTYIWKELGFLGWG